MQSEGATGSRWQSSSLGVREGCGEFARDEVLEMSGDGVPSEHPYGMLAAQA